MTRHLLQQGIESGLEEHGIDNTPAYYIAYKEFNIKRHRVVGNVQCDGTPGIHPHHKESNAKATVVNQAMLNTRTKHDMML
jgi:hypothetical protein